MRRLRGLSQCALLVCIFGLSLACSDASDSGPDIPVYLPVANPVVTDPPDAGSIILQATVFDLADVGYRQREFYLFEGVCRVFAELT